MKSFIYLFFFFTLIIYTSNSQSKKFPFDAEKIQASNAGTEFYFSIPPASISEPGGGYVALYVTSSKKTNFTVQAGKVDIKQETIPNDVVEVKLPIQDALPYYKDRDEPYIPEKVYPGAAIHVLSPEPLIVYVICKFGPYGEGFLALPINSIGKEYIVSSYPDMTNMLPDEYLPSLATITAAHNNTTVRITIGGTGFTTTAGGVKSGASIMKTLHKGDVFVVSSGGPEHDLSGSLISSDKPVAVVSGNQCANIPTTNQWCNYIAEMEIPTNNWGLNYIVPFFKERKKPPLIRIFAKEDNTKIYRDGNQILLIPKGHGGRIDVNFYESRAIPEDQTKKAVIISGNKPINVVLYNPGQQEDGYPHPTSPPFIMELPPLEEYGYEITLMTPGYGTNIFHLNKLYIPMQADSTGSIPDYAMIGEFIDSSFNWTKIKDIAINTYPISFRAFNKKWIIAEVILQNPSAVYKIYSNTVISSLSTGYSETYAYGFASGLMLTTDPITDTVAPEIKYTLQCDGDVDNGTATDMPDDPDVRTNMSFIYLNPDSSFNYTLTNDQFIPGDAVKVNWKLQVIDKNKNARAYLVFSDRALNDTIVIVEYQGLGISVSEGTINIKDSVLGQKTTKYVTIKNTSIKPIGIGALRFDANLDVFKAVYPAIDTLYPGDSIIVEITFVPTAYKDYQAYLILENECYNERLVLIKAEVGEAIIVANDVDLGKTIPNSQSKKSIITISNMGTRDLRITGYEGPFNSAYIVYLPHKSSLAQNPIIIAPNESKQYEVYFYPMTSGQFADSIIFESNAGANIDRIAYINGIGDTVTSVEDMEHKIYAAIAPNPIIRDKAELRLNIKEAGFVEIYIYNELGALIQDVFKGFLSAGEKIISIDCSDLRTGSYYCAIKTKQINVTEKFNIIR